MSASARKILPLLATSIPDSKPELNYRNPYELVIATILSAQCTDERVNKVTAELFQKYPTPSSLAQASLEVLEVEIKSTGFFRDKAKRILACSRTLVEEFGGQLPDSMDDLLRLPGVGRKTANLLLGELFGKPAVVVDTHVRRVANRLGLTKAEDPEEIEKDLQGCFPVADWWPGSSRLLLHGRYVCKAKKPLCSECVLREHCPSASLFLTD